MKKSILDIGREKERKSKILTNYKVFISRQEYPLLLYLEKPEKKKRRIADDKAL
jgi:hypothetical protein